MDLLVLGKAIAQAGLIGAGISQAIEQVRGLFGTNTLLIKRLVLVGCAVFVFGFNVDVLAAAGLASPMLPVLGKVFTVIFAVGGAKLTNDGLNALDRAGDKK